jgi:hypothetical protein
VSGVEKELIASMLRLVAKRRIVSRATITAASTGSQAGAFIFRRSIR